MIEGKKAFGDVIHSEEYLSTIKAYLKDLFGLFPEWVFFLDKELSWYYTD